MDPHWKGQDRIQLARTQRAYDCGIAAAAMIAHLPYAEAARLSPHRCETRGMYPREIRAILTATTGVRWRGPWFAWLTRIGKLPQRTYPTLVVIRQPGHWGKAHAVVIYDDLVYDPNFHRGFFIECYERRHWRVLGYYEPTDPGALACVRQQRRAQAAVFAQVHVACFVGPAEYPLFD